MGQGLWEGTVAMRKMSDFFRSMAECSLLFTVAFSGIRDWCIKLLGLNWKVHGPYGMGMERAGMDEFCMSREET